MKKRNLICIVLLFLTFLLLISNYVSANELNTQLIVYYTNVAPLQSQDIPNITMSMNSNRTNFFNLDDYFLDNETLSYNFTTVNNITILINETTHLVSFFPQTNFSGNITLQFIASDGYTDTYSNEFTIFVIRDSTPPQWSNIGIDKTTIYQNSIVRLSVDWTENINLERYILSINEFGVWVNYTAKAFSGIFNTSSQTIHVGAPEGTKVYWRMTGIDESGNMNTTNISNFTVSSSAGGGSSTDEDEEEEKESTSEEDITPTEKKADYIIEPELTFSLELNQDSNGVVSLKITNIGNTDLEFDISVLKLEMFKHLISKPNFNLSLGESEVITIEFKASDKISPDIYFGEIVVKNKYKTTKLKIAITVKPTKYDLSLNLTIPAKYKFVQPGKVVLANLSFINLGDKKERNVTLYYAITDYSGKVMEFGQESFIYSGENVNLEKSLKVPIDIKNGEYIFFARALTTKGEILIDSDSFLVGEKLKIAAFIQNNFWILLLILFIIILAFIMVENRRNKEKLRLINLYVMITDMKKYMSENKYDDALSTFIKIKNASGEHLSSAEMENKSELKREMEELAKQFTDQQLKKLAEIKKEEDKKQEEINKKENEVKEDKKEEKVEVKSEDKKTEVKEDNKEEKVEVKSEDKKTEEIVNKEKQDRGQEKKESEKDKKETDSKKNITEVKEDKKQEKEKPAEKSKKETKSKNIKSKSISKKIEKKEVKK